MTNKNNKMIISFVGIVLLIGGLWYFVSSHDSNKSGNPKLAALSATVYYQKNCPCCEQFIRNLERNGVQVKKEILSLEDLAKLKSDLGVPRESQACHTTRIADYFVEGHVSLATIQKLINEKPNIDGIALPGMPMGSYGMTGFKTGPLKIQAISDGKATGIFAEE
jgi:hypothetical protein